MNCFRLISVLTLTAGLVVFTFASHSFAQMGLGMHPNIWGGSVERGGEWTYCPYCGSDLQKRDGYEHGARGGYRQDHWDRRGFGPGYGMRSPGMRHPGIRDLAIVLETPIQRTGILMPIRSPW